MYNNLAAEIARKKLNKCVMAKVIKKSRNTLNCKIAGKYPFTYEEALKIHETFFSDCDFKYLFKATYEKN